MGAYTIGIMQNKGGAGKTTTAIALATELALSGQRVLAVDWDKSNPSFTQVLCTDDEISEELYDPQLTVVRLVTMPQAGIRGVLRRVDLAFDAQYRGHPRYPRPQLEAAWRTRGWRVVRDRPEGTLDFIPGHELLGGVLTDLGSGSWGGSDPALTLRRALSEAREQYDYIIIDMGPGNTPDDLGVVNALESADGVLIPLNFLRAAERACVNAVNYMTEFNRGRKRPIALLGIALFGYRQGRATHDGKLVTYRQSPLFQSLLLPTVVPYDTIVEEAQEAGAPVQLFAPFSPAAERYQAMTQEVTNRVHAATQQYARA